MEKILVSACLLGRNCKYDGGNNAKDELIKFLENYEVIPICPEVLGGLQAPRPSSEIQGGTGQDVLNGTSAVTTVEGKDVTAAFVRGAQLALEQAAGAKIAILKANSPSCGNQMVYDGTFSSRKIEGKGVTAALFFNHGITVYDEYDYMKIKG